MGRAEEVLKGLASLREESVLCDVQLEAEGKQISAHKAVLAAASPYFRAMFSGSFRETRSQVVPMKELSYVGLSSVIQCIYTTSIDIDVEKIEDVFPAAHLLQMNDIVDECIEWIGKNINKTNCFKFLKIAERFDNEGVQEVITKFLLENFVAVSEMKDFDEIPKQALVSYISSDALKTDVNEYAVFQAARKWIMANEVEANEITEIMMHIRFGLISPSVLNDLSSDNLIDENKECRKMIRDSLSYHNNIFSQPFYQGALNRPRGEPGLLFIPSSERSEGYNVKNDHVDVEFVSFPKLKIANSLRLDVPVVFSTMRSIQINNFLFVMGVSGNGYQNFAKRYDASSNSWLDLASVPRQAVTGPAIALCGKDIFLLGGMTVTSTSGFGIDPDEIIDDVYVYKISENTWSESNSLPLKLVHSAATQLQGNIYLTGGEPDEGDTSNKVWAYDVKAKMWLTKAPMNHRRYLHQVQA